MPPPPSWARILLIAWGRRRTAIRLSRWLVFVTRLFAKRHPGLLQLLIQEYSEAVSGDSIFGVRQGTADLACWRLGFFGPLSRRRPWCAENLWSTTHILRWTERRALGVFCSAVLSLFPDIPATLILTFLGLRKRE